MSSVKSKVDKYVADIGSVEEASASTSAKLYSKEQFLRSSKSVRIEKTKNSHRKASKSQRKSVARVHKYTPQLGDLGATVSSLHALMQMQGIQLPPRLIDRISTLFALWCSISQSVSASQAVSILYLYIKTEYHGSIADLAYEFLKNLLLSPVPQTGAVEQRPEWLETMKSAASNWMLIVKNEGFSRISHVLSLCLTLGMCDASQMEFSIGGLKIFSAAVAAKHASAFDLMDATVSTVMYFIEGGYACFARRSLKPLLYGSIDLEAFEEAYSQCSRCQEYARCGNLQKIENLTDNDYLSLLSNTIEKCKLLIQTTRGLLEKNIFRRKMDTLRIWENAFMQSRVQGGLRVMPYSIGIYGGTGLGKSSIANTLMITTLRVNGYSAHDDRIVTVNEVDKFMSNFKTCVEGVLVDDIGNTKSDFVGTAPSQLMIQLVNNVRSYANMAEADMKGKVSIEPKVVINTKNVKDSGATIYSNEPASIARRDRITVTVSVLPQYATNGMLDPQKVRNLCPHLFTLDSYRIPDLWSLRVEEAFPVPSPHVGGHATIGWKVIIDQCSLPELIRWVAKDSQEHFANQAKFVATQNDAGKRCQLCPTCNLPIPDVCVCVPKNITPISEDDEDIDDSLSVDESTGSYANYHFQPNVGLIGQETLTRVAQQVADQYTAAYTSVSDVARQQHARCYARLQTLETAPYFRWTNWIPTQCLRSPWIRFAVCFFNSYRLFSNIVSAYLEYVTIMLAIIVAGFFCPPLLLFLIFPLQGIATVVTHEKELLYDRILADNLTMPLMFRNIRDQHVKWFTRSCAALVGLYGLLQLVKLLRPAPVEQGNLAPEGDADILARDAEENQWARPDVTPMPSSLVAKTTTTQQLRTLLFRNLCHVTLTIQVKGEVKRYETNCFFIKSNVALFPAHMWKADSAVASFVRHHPDSIGGNFKGFLDRSQSVDIPNTDLSLVWVPSGGDWKDLTEYLPLTQYRSCGGSLIYKKSNSDMLFSELYLTPGTVHTYKSFPGATYNLKFDTFLGLCMAVIVAELPGPVIGGFHLGGVVGKKSGCLGILLRTVFDKAFDELRAKPNVLLCASSGTLETVKYGVQFFESPTVHPKSPIAYLPKKSNVLFHGQVKGRAKYYSEVVQTPISPIVAEVCGVSNIWGKPKFHLWKPWQDSLQYSANPAVGFLGVDLTWAQKDYTDTILTNLKKYPALIADTNPLERMQNLCGRDGVRFIDAIPKGTSIGYPLSGPKRNFIVMEDSKDFPDFASPATLDESFWNEADRMETIYLKGERCYPVFKACLKDEPTKLSSDKVRVFQAAPCALQLVLRKYYLPIARVLSVMPLVSECAVGLNSQGPEWDQMAEHITRFGKDRILAGDYSKYDLRLPAQVMFAAFRVMIDIAKACGYGESDVTVMEGLATDVCYPLMAYNGDLVQLFGSNPSGHNLTVYVNSVCNSLMMRCAYHGLVANPVKFQTDCAITTYGDDVKGSVRSGVENFNHVTVADYFAAYDIVFTMPDKSGKPIPFLTDETADFLKRHNKYIPELGTYFGALDEMSIFKSLHCVLKSDAVTVEQQCMQNIDTALREWFFHGKVTYEARRAEMITVATRANISHGCPMLSVTFAEQCEKWKTTYIEDEFRDLFDHPQSD